MKRLKSDKALEGYLREGTGSIQPESHVQKTIKYRLGKFEITVLLGSGDRFLGISEISVSRDFLDRAQRRKVSGYHDVERFYFGTDDEG